jgi:hypothetical protein
MHHPAVAARLHRLRDAAQSVIVNTRRFNTSANFTKDPTSSSPKPNQQAENPSFPSFNLFKQLREAKPAVRYTVYAGLGLMATVESTFWIHVLRAKFFPRGSKEEQEKADALLGRMNDALKGYRHVWLANYGRYYGVYIWGLGYGGLDGLEGNGY